MQVKRQQWLRLIVKPKNAKTINLITSADTVDLTKNVPQHDDYDDDDESGDDVDDEDDYEEEEKK